MTSLLVKRLLTGFKLEQKFNLKLEGRYHVEAFYPYLYIHNAPAGLFTLDFFNDETDDLVHSRNFSSIDVLGSVNETPGNFGHVFFPVIPTTKLKLNKGAYRAELTADSEYVYQTNSFIGWIQQHEDLNNVLDYVPNNDLENPLAMRIKVLKEGIQ